MYRMGVRINIWLILLQNLLLGLLILILCENLSFKFGFTLLFFFFFIFLVFFGFFLKIKINAILDFPLIFFFIKNTILEDIIFFL
jgi:hypothetical protein